MEKTTVMATMAVLVGIIMVGSVLVPIVNIQSQETTTITNSGAGDLRYAYYDEPTSYFASAVYDSGTDKISLYDTTEIDAADMIFWASDVGSVVFADGKFTFLYDNEGTMTAVDLGDGYAVTGSLDGVEVNSNNIADPIDVTAEWAYVEDSDGVFGFFTDTGKTVKDFPTAAMGSFAGAYAYDELNSLGMSTLVPTYSVSDGVFTQGDWELDTDTTAVSASYNSPIYGSTVTADFKEGLVANATVDPSTGTLVDDLYYTFSGTSATVVGISSTLSSATSITIPDTVTSDGTTYNVTAISSNVFTSMAALENITLPSGLTSIGDSAFFGCRSLALTELPSGLTSIGYSAFYNCTALALTELPSGLTSINNNVFYNCTSLALTELPSGLTSINTSAFSGCTSLALTELPSGLTTIGESAFSGCTSLALTELPSGLTSIGYSAFSGCTSLALTELPSGLTSIGGSAFLNCTNLTNLVITGSPTIGNNAFKNTNIAEVLNLGDTEITAGSYGLSADCVVDDAIRAIGYIAPVSFSETVQKEGAEYDLMLIIPMVVIGGLLMASVVMFGLVRRSDY